MDGHEVTPEMRERCIEALEGRATTEEYLRQLVVKDRAIREALASARIEGLDVTEQTALDVARLLSSELTPEEIAREILSRESREPKQSK